MNTVNKNSIKVKFLFVMILSNASVYLLCLDSSPIREKRVNSIREHYIPIKIRGNLRTVLNQDYPVQIVFKNQVLKNIFILKKYEISSNMLTAQSPRQEYLIHIHKDSAGLIKQSSIYDIYPLSMKLNEKSKERGSVYEIYF